MEWRGGGFHVPWNSMGRIDGERKRGMLNGTGFRFSVETAECYWYEKSEVKLNR